MKSVATILKSLVWLGVLLDPVSQVSALTLEYCSSQNTGSSNGAMTSTYQSNGLCYNECVADYAFAILLGKKCWCSNYAPSETVSTSECDDDCPGYPSDDCGNADEGYYAYIALSSAASGTVGASSTAASSTSTSTSNAYTSTIVTLMQTSVVTTVVSKSSSQKAVTSIKTSTTTSKIKTTLVTKTSHSKSSSTSSSRSSTTTTSSTSTSTWTPTPVVSVVTITGQVHTMTVTPTAPGNTTSDTSDGSSSGGGYWNNRAAVIGTFVPVSLIAAAIIAGIVVYVWKKRAARGVALSSQNGDPLVRNGSKHSQMTLMTDPGKGWSFAGGRADSDNSGEPGTATTTRMSMPLRVDQRLDPIAFMRHSNVSHQSLASLQDDQDYSRRVLTVANPDS